MRAIVLGGGIISMQMIFKMRERLFYGADARRCGYSDIEMRKKVFYENGDAI
jgi:hypothetical protein